MARVSVTAVGYTRSTAPCRADRSAAQASARPEPQLHRVQDPFGALVARAKGGVVIELSAVIKESQTSEDDT